MRATDGATLNLNALQSLVTPTADSRTLTVTTCGTISLATFSNADGTRITVDATSTLAMPALTNIDRAAFTVTEGGEIIRFTGGEGEGEGEGESEGEGEGEGEDPCATACEDIALVPGVTLAAILDNIVVIEGTVLGADDSTLIDVEIAATAAKGVEPLLDLNNIAMNVLGVTFRGTSTRTETALRITGAALTDSLIEGCTFTSVGVGIDIAVGIPVIRRSLFENISDTGIVLRDTATGTALSQDTDAASGFNAFDVPTIDGLAIDDQSGQEFPVQNNDWGTDDITLFEASIAGQNEFMPFLAQGQAILSSALFIVVVDAASQNSVTNCSITLEASSLDPVTDNVDGVYAYPALEAGTYSVTAPGFDDVTTDATLSAGQLLTLTIPLGIVSTEPPDAKGSGCYARGTNGTTSLQTILELRIVIALILLLNIGTRKECER